jgi:hypothetical protein
VKTYLDCIPCFIRQGLEAARSVSADEVVIARALKRVLAETATFDLNLSPPEMGQIIHQIIREETGNSDPYKEIKDSSITFALSIEDKVNKLICDSENPFETALRFSIAGNILDFALLSTWHDSRIDDSFKGALEKNIDLSVVKELEDEIRKSKHVLFLADNAGETVFDRMFIETFPQGTKVTYVVKGGPIINDATLECAEKSGLQHVSRIIDNGSNAPGTVLNLCSKEFIEEFDKAAVVIAKGQANFETLNDSSRQVFLLLQMKCPVISSHYNYDLGDWLVATTDKLAGR